MIVHKEEVIGISQTSNYKGRKNYYGVAYNYNQKNYRGELKNVPLINSIKVYCLRWQVDQLKITPNQKFKGFKIDKSGIL